MCMCVFPKHTSILGIDNMNDGWHYQHIHRGFFDCRRTPRIRHTRQAAKKSLLGTWRQYSLYAWTFRTLSQARVSWYKCRVHFTWLPERCCNTRGDDFCQGEHPLPARSSQSFPPPCWDAILVWRKPMKHTIFDSLTSSGNFHWHYSSAGHRGNSHLQSLESGQSLWSQLPS